MDRNTAPSQRRRWHSDLKVYTPGQFLHILHSAPAIFSRLIMSQNAFTAASTDWRLVRLFGFLHLGMVKARR